jgi:hypothetical protein
MWVAVGEGTYSIASSTDGDTWVGQNSTIFVTGHGAAWGNNIWVAVGAGSSVTPNEYDIATSTDGITWTEQGVNIFQAGQANGVAYNGSRWVAVGFGTNTIAYSDNGTSWSPSINGNSTLSIAQGVAWNGTLWIVGGYGANRIAYSLDGITWTGSTSGNGVFNTTDASGNPISKVYGLGWNGTMMIAVADDAINTIAYSIDGGITWVGLGKTIFTTYGYSVTWNGQMWVATGKGTNTIAYSYNGKNWNGSGTSAINDTGFGVAFNSRRPYTLTISTTQTSTSIGTVPNASLPIVVPANSQLDIVSDSYYNSGYTNFSIALQTHAS